MSEEIPNGRYLDCLAVKFVLTGISVVDAVKSWFHDKKDVTEFLQLLEIDTDNPMDMAYLSDLHREAIDYLEDVLHYTVPLECQSVNEIHDLFLMARHEETKLQTFACMILKIMHIMFHIRGHEVVFNTPISEAQLFQRLNNKTFAILDKMRTDGIGVVEFTSGKKSHTSLVTKLLAKRENLAAHIFDKMRFRVVLSNKKNLIQALIYLGRHLHPWNYVIPGQSQNNILSRGDLDSEFGPDIMDQVFGREDVLKNEQENEFSGQTYRVINFVVDIPLRIDDVAPQYTPAVAFAQTEIQLIDSETAKLNSQGENAHSHYKHRQLDRVRDRIQATLRV